MAFNAMVKSAPRGAAKGRFQCEISNAGLTLTQRKKVITIPAGTTASYAGKNRLDIELPDYRLEVQVTKFGSYQNRLAKDIATFLSTGGNAPRIADYSLPWYFYAISALPLGIPIITLGGAIPAALGFGLASACFGISQKEDWSVPTRLLAAGMLAMLGYVTLFVILAVLIASRTG